MLDMLSIEFEEHTTTINEVEGGDDEVHFIGEFEQECTQKHNLKMSQRLET